MPKDNEQQETEHRKDKQSSAEIAVPDITGTAVSVAMHTGTGLTSPFMKEIYLTRQTIVGLRFQGGAADLVKDLSPGERITFLREPDNKYDSKAIMALDEDGRRLGYIPRHENHILSALMDAGKMIYGVVPDGEFVQRANDRTPYLLQVDLFMREFALPDDLTEVPRHGYQGSYAVIDGDLLSKPGEYWISDICVIKVINGEERGLFERSLSEDAEEDEYQEMIRSLEHFVGKLPLVGHGINKEVRRCLEDAYGVILGKTFTNQVIDTRIMAKNHISWARDYTLEKLAQELGIEAEGGNENEIRCRKIWQLYCRMEKSELD